MCETPFACSRVRASWCCPSSRSDGNPSQGLRRVPPMKSVLPVALFAVVLCSCPAKKPDPDPMPSGRCEVDLAASGLFSAVGNGARAKKIDNASELVGGPNAQGVVGDFILENDKIRVIVQ